MQEEWTSPDDKIFKKLLIPGEIGLKPFETSQVKLHIIDCPEELLPFNDKTFTIGDIDGDLGRLLDICVSTMFLKEKAKFTLSLDSLEQVTAVIELVDLQFGGFIYEWSAKKKYELAMKHKEKGAEFFNQKSNVEAAHRFNKALKILSSIPINVEDRPREIDDVSLQDIELLKEKLFSNLASCYFREQVYELVIPLCEKALQIDSNNVKALYKIGVAYENDKNFEKAHEALSKLLVIEPHNKAGAEHLASVNANLKKADVRVNDIMKKMILGSIGANGK